MIELMRANGWAWGLQCADAREALRAMPDESVHCCITSPPYWGLRSYIQNGDPLKPFEIGLEPTPEKYVENLVEVFVEVRRVLRPDGTLWLNLGDCYATGGGKVGEHPGGGQQGARWKGEIGRHRDDLRRNHNGLDRPSNVPLNVGRGVHTAENAGKHASAVAQMGPMTQPNRMPIEGLKPKDLVGAPWRVAFALQASGWYLRSDIIWFKGNPLPESVQDRPTKAHEYVFLFSKNERYYYDSAAIAEPATSRRPSGNGFAGRQGGSARVGPQSGGQGSLQKWEDVGGTRNRRTVWQVNTKPFKDAHFATWPPDLIEPMILAGCPRGGIVLDPFVGSGTTILVALRNGRQAIGIDLNPAYVQMAKARIEGIEAQ